MNRVTEGQWALRSGGGMPAFIQGAVVSVDDREGMVYVTALEASPLERHLYRVRLDGSGFTRLTDYSRSPRRLLQSELPLLS